jgi:hypothetical protein
MSGYSRLSPALALVLRLLGRGLFYLLLLACSLWLGLALWVHQPLGPILSKSLIVLWGILSCAVFGLFFCRNIPALKVLLLLYLCSFGSALAVYFSLAARNDRPWQADVARVFDYQQHGSYIQLHNVRNFTWRSEQDYDARWETRHYDLNQLQGMDLILSYWSLPQIAHTLLSFRFNDGQVLSFSIETRKEQAEQFSSLGGFFRLYELAFVAADEKDIVYTRSNIRHEQVYIYPIKAPKAELQALFLSYLKQGQALQQSPRWYNTLLSNCTTLVFEMAHTIHPIPLDYRILLSGLLPDYFYQHHALSQHYSLSQWQQMAYINPKVAHFEQLPDQSSRHFSQLIRQSLPQD